MHLTNFHFYPYKNYLYSKHLKGLQGCGLGYRFSFNGKEKDNETYGEGNAYDFGARIQDPRLGRWLSLDPQAAKYPFLSPYNAFADNPILFIDPEGETIKISTDKPELTTKFKSVISVAFSGKVEAIIKDGIVTFHQLPDTKLTDYEAAALNILSGLATNEKYTANLKLADHKNGGEKITTDNFNTGAIDLDDVLNFGNDDNLQTSKSVLVHIIAEQFKKDDLMKHGFKETDEELYDASHDYALDAESKTTNLQRKATGAESYGAGDGTMIKKNDALVKQEDGTTKKVIYRTYYKDNNMECQDTTPKP